MKVVLISLLAGAAACGGSSGASSTGFAIVAAPGEALTANAGDAVQLAVVQTFSDESQDDLPDGATAAFTLPATVASLPADSSADSPLPAFGADPTGVFVTNALRTDRPADLASVLFVLDAGTAGSGSITVTATISGTTTGSATVSIPVSAVPAGDAGRGATTYAAACATCHGDAAAGSPANPDGTTYTLAGSAYSYPAPGLDTADGNLAGDPDWNAALLSFSARTDIDNGGLELRAPMPDWLSVPETTGGALLTTQDFADIYAFLKTK